jgi:hypothetical protein
MRRLACATPSHFPAKADLAEQRGALRNRAITQARGHGGDDAKIHRRLVDAHATGDVHEDIVGDQVEPGALLRGQRGAARGRF